MLHLACHSISVTSMLLFTDVMAADKQPAPSGTPVGRQSWHALRRAPNCTALGGCGSPDPGQPRTLKSQNRILLRLSAWTCPQVRQLCTAEAALILRSRKGGLLCLSTLTQPQMRKLCTAAADPIP